MFLAKSRLHGGDEATREAIRTWAQERKFDVVAWTDLPSDFKKKIEKPSSVNVACKHLHRNSVKAMSASGTFACVTQVDLFERVHESLR